jgi:uncharacterized protein YndB with AHSA1/START domain
MTPAIRSETPDDATVVVTAVVPAAAQRVFDAFTDPAELARWWWPERFATTYEVDARPGGAFHIVSTGLPEGQNMGIRGAYLEVDAPRRLAMTWTWDGNDDETRVVIELRPLDERRTEVAVTHSANASVEARDNHGLGWHDCLARLVELAEAGAGA